MEVALYSFSVESLVSMFSVPLKSTQAGSFFSFIKELYITKFKKIHRVNVK
jgi:hypothetical protein